MYVGCTNDLKHRFDLHNLGQVHSTRGREPLELLFYECFSNKLDAFAREKWLKTGWGKSQIRKMLHNHLGSLVG